VREAFSLVDSAEPGKRLAEPERARDEGTFLALLAAVAVDNGPRPSSLRIASTVAARRARFTSPWPRREQRSSAASSLSLPGHCVLGLSLLGPALAVDQVLDRIDRPAPALGLAIGHLPLAREIDGPL